MNEGLIILFLHTVIVWPLILRIIMRKMDVSVTYTWLLLLLFLPIIGSILYILIGELNLGKKKLKRAALIEPDLLDYSFRFGRKTSF